MLDKMITPTIFELAIAEWGSANYFQSLALRYGILRRPLGIFFDSKGFDAEKNDIHVVAKWGEWVVGCLILKDHGVAFKMRQVAVLDDWQGNGVGKKMVLYSEKIARDLGKTTIVLHARQSAIPFYLTLNYNIEGDEFEEIGLPHRSMYKLIGR
ncbi:MAG: GNAT family N-acetyltransferase [Flavobacteriales bacterium]|nr:MAG: GNAT family N-acetyltransferase [Flavobacteriales bacterium]